LCDIFQDQTRYEITGDDKENVNPDKTAGYLRNARVEQNYGNDSDCPQTIDIRTIFHDESRKAA
jgi:hypothetical protein